MSHINSPDPAQLPSLKQLRLTTALVVVGAAFIVFAIVLPAEKGLDPTGVGKAIGLLEMGQIKEEIASEAFADSIEARARVLADSARVVDSLLIMRISEAPEASMRTDTVRITVPATAEREIRFRMRDSAWARYAWSTNRGVLDADVRGDSVGAPEYWFRHYGYATNERERHGVLRAGFAGSHGIMWQNLGDSSVVVTLFAKGNYDQIVRTVRP